MPLVAMPHAPSHRPTWSLARQLLPRGLALIYLLALSSWWVQWEGLVGPNGIAPLADLMQNIAAFEQREQVSLFTQYPTLFHWRHDPTMVHSLLAIGCAAAIAVFIGLWQGPLLLLLWAIYLSLAVTGDVFMGFQWDALLLESGLLCLFIAPWRLWTSLSHREPPPRLAIFLVHALIFRLMFLSGLVKLAGGDSTWTSQNALLYHYFTQPLPNPLSWSAHHLPEWLHRSSCVLMFVIEIVLPFAIFLGRKGRFLAAAGFSTLMLLVFLTGNYTFFNLLTLALCTTLLDDQSYRRLRRLFQPDPTPEQTPSAPDSAALPTPPASPRLMRLRLLPVSLFAAVSLPLTLAAADAFLATRLPGYQTLLPKPLHQAYSSVQALRSFNAYGLFQAMTTERREIVLEVSDDGIFWLPVEFRWKPGALDRSPRWAAPHQPRLDWQMWFAALSPGYDPQRDAHPQSPLFWFGRFLQGLLQHQQPIWTLLEPPPFPIEKITHVRARLWRYHFTSPSDRAETGATWQRELLGSFSPPLSLRRTP